MKGIETPTFVHRGKLEQGGVKNPNVMTVNILGKVTERPRYDLRTNPVHRAIFQMQ